VDVLLGMVAVAPVVLVVDVVELVVAGAVEEAVEEVVEEVVEDDRFRLRRLSLILIGSQSFGIRELWPCNLYTILLWCCSIVPSRAS